MGESRLYSNMGNGLSRGKGAVRRLPDPGNSRAAIDPRLVRGRRDRRDTAAFVASQHHDG